MGQNRENEQMEALEAFICQGVIESVLGTVKSGKEATVYSCRGAGGGLVAAKVYRARTVRGFSNDAAYTAGRHRRTTRYSRAIETKTRRGREFAFSAWVSEEYATLSLLHRAGADVPEPYAQSESVILMEYVGDEDAPASPLSAVDLGGDEAQRVFERVMRNIELTLACYRVHGDLSPFNVLYHHGGVWLIDFPQAVDARFNLNAHDLLSRDIENMCAYFERCGVAADGRRITHDLWSRFLRAEL